MQDTTILSALVSAVLDAAGAVGLDPAAIAAEAGIDPVALADPDKRVPLVQDIRMWEILSRQPVGLAIGARLGLQGLGVVGYAMRHHGTLGEALAWQQRYNAVVHPDVIPQIERQSGADRELVVFAHAVPPSFLRLREPAEAYAASRWGSQLVRAPGQVPEQVRVAAPFFRAFKRWTGTAPQAFRRRSVRPSTLDCPSPESRPT